VTDTATVTATQQADLTGVEDLEKHSASNKPNTFTASLCTGNQSWGPCHTAVQLSLWHLGNKLGS